MAICKFDKSVTYGRKNHPTLACVSVFDPSLMREGSPFFLEIKGIQFFQKELKPVMRVSAVANLKRFKHKAL